MTRSISCCVLALAAALAMGAASAQEDKKPDFKPIEEVVKGAKTIQNAVDKPPFFKLFKKGEHLYAEIPSGKLNQEFMISVSVAGGIGRGYVVSGMTWSESIFSWKLAGKRMFLIKKNVRHTADAGDPIHSAVEEGFDDSVIAALSIRAKTGNRYLVDLGDFLFTDYGMASRALGAYGLGGYRLDRSRTTWGPVKAFPKNLEIEVVATYAGGSDQDLRTVADARALTITWHYSISEMPDAGYKPRLADDRIGYFLTAVKNYSNDEAEGPFVRYVNRWRLEKADPGADMSPPKEPLIFWMEKSIPYEYRPIVRAGILEWNKAFEKAGFIDAIEVRYQDDQAQWDPEDARYNTIRWAAGELGYAIGPSRVNPRTGEIYDADILVDSGWLESFQWQFEMWADEEGAETAERIRNGETPDANPGLRHEGHGHTCEKGQFMREQMALAIMAAAPADDEEARKAARKEFIRQGLKELVMHEVGHTLGLRHNFKSSAVVPLGKLHDKAYAEQHGLVGSVMDYSAINLAPPGEQQGYYFTPTLGPWDYLAIEYGYKQIPGGTDAEKEALQAIAARAAEPQHAYATDGDIGYDMDPLVNTRDMSDDLIGWAKQRQAVVTELWTDVAGRVVSDGEGYQKARRAFLYSLYEMQKAQRFAARYVGGMYFRRVHKGDPGDHAPLEPVAFEQQQAALEFITQTALSDEAFDFDPALLARLAPNRWDHWGSDSPSRLDVALHDRVVSGMMSVVREVMDPNVLRRIHDSRLYAKEDEKTVTLDQVYAQITDAVFSELQDEAAAGETYISPYRRDLQREYLKGILIPHVLRPSGSLPEDIRALAYQELRQLVIETKAAVDKARPEGAMDGLSHAHLVEMRRRIQSALAAAFEMRN